MIMKESRNQDVKRRQMKNRRRISIEGRKVYISKNKELKLEVI